jgi:hypothetical protein
VIALSAKIDDPVPLQEITPHHWAFADARAMLSRPPVLLNPGQGDAGRNRTGRRSKTRCDPFSSVGSDHVFTL